MARPKKEKSLHRGKRVYIRFTELEYELVAGYAKDAGYPIGTFVRKQALREKLEVNYNIVADLGEIQNLTVQAAGIGNNRQKLTTVNLLSTPALYARCIRANRRAGTEFRGRSSAGCGAAGPGRGG